MTEPITIGVDHGYAAMKTAHCSFPSGLAEYEHEPYTQKNVLRYDGKYYVVGSGRQPLQKDKTADENYYLLTLAAIAKEIAYRRARQQNHARAFCALPDPRRPCRCGYRGGRGLCPFLRVLQAQGARHRSGMPAAARKIRRQGSRHDGSAPVSSRCWQKNCESAAGRSLQSSRLGRLRHALHPHHKPSGALRGQGPGKG